MPRKENADDNHPLDDFIQELTSAQGNLRAYILASLGNRSEAEDVLQRTNLALWKNATSFRTGAPFLPWAITLAKYEVLSHCRDKSRDRHVFPEDLAELMLKEASEELKDPVERLNALRHCLGKLSSTHSEILQLRYYEEMSIHQISSTLQRSEDSVKSILVRIRKALQDCIQRQLKSSLMH